MAKHFKVLVTTDEGVLLLEQKVQVTDPTEDLDALFEGARNDPSYPIVLEEKDCRPGSLTYKDATWDVGGCVLRELWVAVNAGRRE